MEYSLWRVGTLDNPHAVKRMWEAFFPNEQILISGEQVLLLTYRYPPGAIQGVLNLDRKFSTEDDAMTRKYR